MALTTLLRILPFHVRKKTQLNFPLQHSTSTEKTNNTLQKFIETVTKSSYYNWQNFITSKIIRSSFSEDPKVQTAASSSSESQTSASSPKMEREITRRRSIAVMMLLSVFLAASPAFGSSSETDFIKKTISSHTVVIFSKSYCPYCRRAKEVLKELNQAPHVIELDERDDGFSIQDALGGIVGRHTVPQVFINGKHIGGSDDTVEAYQNGELAKLLGIDSTDHDDL